MSIDIKLPNIPQASVDGIIELLSQIYCGVTEKGLPLKTVPAVMLWGPPGVGKSQAVRQTAHEIALKTGKRTVITDVRLLLFNPIDLRGIPTSNADKTLAVWLKPKIFQMDEDEKVVNILFLDEISAAPQSVQAAAYQIALDRVIGEHRLPENCIVIAAGNRVTDKSVAYKMPKALANRLLHIEVQGSIESWKRWAIESGVNEQVIGYLGFRPDRLYGFDAESEELAFPTPRSWEMVSNVLNCTDGDAAKNRLLISGLVGMGAAAEFCAWCAVYRELPSVEDIFKGKQAGVPESVSALYALVSAMTAYARAHKDDMDKIENSIKYAERLPADFSVILLKDYMYIEKGYKNKLMRMPEFERWLTAKGSLLNGAFR